MTEQKEQWQLEWAVRKQQEEKWHQFTKENGYISISEMAKNWDCCEDLLRYWDKYCIYDEVNARIKDRANVGTGTSQKEIDDMEKYLCDPDYVCGARKLHLEKNLREWGYKTEWERKQEAKEKKTADIEQQKKDIMETMDMDIDETSEDEKIQKNLSLDYNIIILCSGNNTSDIASKAIVEYAKNPAEDVKSELSKLQLKKQAKV